MNKIAIFAGKDKMAVRLCSALILVSFVRSRSSVLTVFFVFYNEAWQHGE